MSNCGNWRKLNSRGRIQIITISTRIFDNKDRKILVILLQSHLMAGKILKSFALLSHFHC